MPDPKVADQPAVTPRGTLTQNGRFCRAVESLKRNERSAPVVRVYEKIHEGVWAYNGLFDLVDSRKEHDGKRWLFRYRLIASLSAEDAVATVEPMRRRLIPTRIKVEVWKRDQGRCVECGATTELHFDHDYPFSKGGTSIAAANVQLLCARHNLSKGAKIL